MFLKGLCLQPLPNHLEGQKTTEKCSLCHSNGSHLFHRYGHPDWRTRLFSLKQIWRYNLALAFPFKVALFSYIQIMLLWSSESFQFQELVSMNTVVVCCGIDHYVFFNSDSSFLSACFHFLFTTLIVHHVHLSGYRKRRDCQAQHRLFVWRFALSFRWFSLELLVFSLSSWRKTKCVPWVYVYERKVRVKAERELFFPCYWKQNVDRYAYGCIFHLASYTKDNNIWWS